MQYEYSAKSTAGETLSGLLSAASLQEVQRLVREKGLFFVSARPAGRGAAARSPARRGGRRGRVAKRDLVTLTAQLAIMTRSGVDLATALGNLAAQAAQPALRTVLHEIHGDVIAGKPVSTAMGRHEAVFGQTYIAGIAAAEASGKLPEVLNRLSVLLRGEMRLRATLRGLLAYPVVLSSVSVLVVSGLMFFVLPQFAKVFDQMGMTLPAITQLLISAASELRGRWWLWGGLLAGGATAAAMFAASPRGKQWSQRTLINLPVVRNISRALLIGRALRLLSTMLASGVPLLDGLRLTRASGGNVVLESFFRQVEEDVLNGRGIAPAFLSASFIPPAAAQMVATAEQTGTLATVMELVGEFYEEEGETRLRELSTILEPLIIILMGLVVAVVVMSVMLPIFDFATVAK